MGAPSPRRLPGVEVPMPHLGAEAGTCCLDFCTPQGGFCTDSLQCLQEDFKG